MSLKSQQSKTGSTWCRGHYTIPLGHGTSVACIYCLTLRPRTSAHLAVKEYVRSGAGHEFPDANELRPPPVLVQTVDHLIRK